MKKNKLLIVGGGPAAVSLCLQVVDEYRKHRLNVPVEIHVFEKGHQIGPGLPYSNLLDDCYILNLPKEIMEPIAGTTGHFAEWLKSKPMVKQETKFPPRKYFGEYLHFLAEKIKIEANEIGISITYHTNCEVLDVEDQRKTGTIKVITTQGDTIGNYLVFCTGHMPSSTYSHFIGKQGYFHNPWELDLYKKLDSYSEVTVIGTRLTAIDTVRKLLTSGYGGKIRMVSRSGLLPTVLSKEIPPYTLKYLTLANFDRLTKGGVQPLSLKDLAELSFAEINEAEGRAVLPDNFVRSYRELSSEAWLTQQIIQAESGPKKWQQVLFAAYPIVSNIWSMLTLQDKKSFIRNYRSIYLTYLAAFPLENAYKIREHLTSGRLDILGGVTDINPCKEGGFALHFADRSPISTKVLVNATGPSYQPEMDPLFRRLLNKGLLVKHEVGGIDVDPISLRTLSSNQVKHQKIFGIGEITQGACLATTDMSRVATQAGKVALQLVRDCFPLTSKQQKRSFSFASQNKHFLPTPNSRVQVQYGAFFRKSENLIKKNPAVFVAGAALSLSIIAGKNGLKR